LDSDVEEDSRLHRSHLVQASSLKLMFDNSILYSVGYCKQQKEKDNDNDNV